MKERWDASRLKSTQIDPNAPEMNVCRILNVAQKDEGERARSQAGRPPIGRPDSYRPAGPTLSGVAPGFWSLPPRTFYFRAIGCFGPERERKQGGEKERH